MIKHYLIVAFRNLWKYKAQSGISIIGLAVGFTCFALASLWIRYEMTYDSFHPKADRLYTINTPSSFNPHGFQRKNPSPLAAYLKEKFPEVTNACSFLAFETEIKINSVKYALRLAYIDSSFLSMFDISVVEGNLDFTIPESNKIAISEKKSKELFGDESPLGKVTDKGTICAVVSGYSEHSNYPFDALRATQPQPNPVWEWRVSGYETLIELAPGVDAAAFKEKVYEHKIKYDDASELSKIMITPLTSMHYEDPNIKREVKFEYIVLFALSGTLVILCSLFNFLTLFVCRFKMREKEFALRMLAGASGRSLLSLWSVEFLMTLIPAFLLGLALIKATLSPFLKLSDIQMDISSVYLESVLYIGAIIAVSLLVYITILQIFRRKSLNASIRKSNKNLFRNVSIVFQLVISIGFIFCTTVMIKQLYFLRHTDLGFTYKNTGSVFVDRTAYSEALENQLKQFPEITETLRGYNPLLPVTYEVGSEITDWEDKSSDKENINVNLHFISKQYVEFYEMQLIEGEMLSEDESKENVLINESAVKAFGWEHPVRKKFTYNKNTVKGVIRNVYSSLPTVPVKPVIYYFGKARDNAECYVTFKYQEGKWKECKDKIEELMKKEDADYQFTISNMEEEYDKYLVSENALLKLLSLLSLVCIIISVFGVFSLISLSCEERRKEIAIRKINGATMQDILAMYFKTYFMLLIIGAVVAFPTGYYIMKQWLEQYIKQTGIDAWIYMSIICVMAFVIILCVGWRVYKASIENPAEVIKTE
jgi:ABC-type antimicrobial peptide transport system permease subunit